MDKVTFYYGPKVDFMRYLPHGTPVVTLSELAIQSDKKMREHVFKIQGRKNDDTASPEKIFIPCLVGFSDQYAAVSDSAIQAFLSFVAQYDIGSMFLQNPPTQLVNQFTNLHMPSETLRYSYNSVTKDTLRKINECYSGAIIGQEDVLRRLLVALHPLTRETHCKPAVLLFYGPAGVGKSETARFLSRVLGQKLFRKQLSMFHSNELASYMFGGRHTQSCLSKDLMDRESNILLFDEFDKPDPVFHSAFYQLFDEGVYEDKNYRAKINRAVIICTSNYSSKDEAKKYMGAPLFSRFDDIIKFSPLSCEAIKIIAANECGAYLSGLPEDEAGTLDAEKILEDVMANLENLDNARSVKQHVHHIMSDTLLNNILNS